MLKLKAHSSNQVRTYEVQRRRLQCTILEVPRWTWLETMGTELQKAMGVVLQHLLRVRSQRKVHYLWGLPRFVQVSGGESATFAFF